MKQKDGDKTPSSFTETVQLVEEYVKVEIIKETETKQLYYHTLDHAVAVKRRAKHIFQAVKSVLFQHYSDPELTRLENLTSLCGLAHDMVQLFDSSRSPNQPRRRHAGVSENATSKKLLKYIQSLNQKLATNISDPTILFSDRDQQIIQDAIAATVCQIDPQAERFDQFSTISIHQPYLYDSQPKISVVGNIIALADLGTLGMEGVDNFIKDGILVFLEDNLEFKELILNCNTQKYISPDFQNNRSRSQLKSRLLAMSRFMVKLAYDRQARFELEIAQFSLPARKILRDQVFIYLNQENIAKIDALIPTQENVELIKLMDFFCLNKA